MSNFRTDYEEIYDKIKRKVDLWFRRIYVISFNCYAWFWLYRQIFIRHSDSFEDYLLWAFTTFGMYYFVLDGKDITLTGLKKILVSYGLVLVEHLKQHQKKMHFM